MGIETNLNISPYFDDFLPANDFHQVIYNSGLVLQARELTQTQSIIHDKIEQLGKFNLTEGSVLEGCNFSYDPNVRFIRIRDTEVLATTDGTVSSSRGLDVDVDSLGRGMLLSGEMSGAVAEIVDAADGYETDPSDTKTVYFKYIGKRTSFGEASPEFQSGENILVVPKSDTPLANVVVETGTSTSTSGNGYSDDNVILVGDATITVTTNSGEVTSATIAPTDSTVNVEDILLSASTVKVSLAPDSASKSVESEAKLNFNFQNSKRFTSITGTAAKPVTGFSYQFAIEDGYVWQKGTALRVASQDVIVEKYTNRPDGKSVVFDIEEEFVTHAVDRRLLDNAHGFNNENAPGADRLKLTPNLAVAETDSISATHTKLVEFHDGKPVRVNQTARLGTIGDIIARRADETHGDYVVNPFGVVAQTDDSTEENGYGQLHLAVSSGLAYVKGYRQQFLSTTRVPLDRGYGNTTIAEDQSLTAQLDNYVLVDNGFGTPVSDGGVVCFTDEAVYVSMPPTPPHDDSLNSAMTVFTKKDGATTNVIGAAWVRGCEVDRDDHSRLKVYLIGSPPDDARGIVAGSGNDIFFYGDLHTEPDPRDSNVPVVSKSSSVDTVAIFPLGHKAASNVYSASTVFVDDSVYISGKTSTSSPHDDPDSGINVKSGGAITLPGRSEDHDGTFVISFREAAGTLSAGTVLHGLSEGVVLDGDEVRIDAISNVSPVNAYVQYARTIADSDSLHRAKTDLEATLTIGSNAISNGQDILTLGVPDAYEIISVTVGSTDRTEDFELSDGQRGTHYGTGSVTRKTGVELTGSDDVEIVFKHYRHDSAASKPSVFTRNSYPSDTPVENIPVYVSATGTRYDLRDCVDFRPSVKVHADISSDVSSATETWTGTISGGDESEVANEFDVNSGLSTHVLPNFDFGFDVVKHLGRVDLLEINKRGDMNIVEGEPALDPAPPYPSSDAMVVTTVEVPPFPALDTVTAQNAKRYDLAVRINDRQRRRLTQANLSGIGERVRALEYYASLNLLERDTSDLVIRSEIDATLNRFKHGIFVDNFENLTVGDFNDPEFKASVDPARGLMQPRFKSYDIEMEVHSPVAARELGDDNGLYGLPTEDDELAITQTQGTTSRVCAGSVYNYRGDVGLTPDYDNGPDVTRGPVKTINVDIDTAGPALAVLDEINTILVDQFTEEDVVATQDRRVTRETTTSGNTVTRRVHTDITTTATTTRTHDQLTGRTETQSSTQRVGDFVTDVSFQRYIRSRRLEFLATGLMPNVRHWIFFDGEDVTSLCRRKSENSFVNGMVSSDDGELRGDFYLPGGRFFVGDRNFIVLSEPTLDNRAEALSAAAGRFSAYNFSANRSGLDLNLNTRSLGIDSSEVVNTEVMRTYRRLTSVSTQRLDLSLTPRRAGQITANWNKITDATGYILQWSNANGTDVTANGRTISNPNTTSGTLSGLTEGASYVVKVETTGL